MQIKNELRQELKTQRKNIKNKSFLDERICTNLINCDVYNKAKTVLFYAALDDEINVDKCIENALISGKMVALPACLDSVGNMKYYFINSLADLKTGFFGLREPDTEICQEVTDFKDSICIVPAIAFDKQGYRLGYGKGYYDRFLQNFSFISVGLCYNEFVKDSLPIGEYDVPVNYIITENDIFSV
ncbi:MAG: 5-formyltetrahydrofolate cyclo-ligase [Eubacterium sp.]|nr:5-formyltetrahydrofolate cyclo-ligase [Eubacterium sp.]